MKVWIDQDCCTGAGLCVDHCPDLFVVLSDGIGYVHQGGVAITDPGLPHAVVPVRYQRDAIEAAERCPGECIYLETIPQQQFAVDDGDIIDAEIISGPGKRG